MNSAPGDRRKGRYALFGSLSSESWTVLNVAWTTVAPDFFDNGSSDT